MGNTKKGHNKTGRAKVVSSKRRASRNPALNRKNRVFVLVTTYGESVSWLLWRLQVL